MGRLKNQVLGDPSGRTGNVIFRIRNEQAISYAVPSKINISNSQKAKDTRSRMGAVAKFQSFINKISELHDIWKLANVEAPNAYLKISKINSKHFEPENPTVNNWIVPNHDIEQLIDIESRLSSSGLNLKVIVNHKKFVPDKREKYIKGIGVISFYQPKKEMEEQFHLYKMITDSVDFRTEGTFEISIPFNEEGQENYYLYAKSILYFTFVSKDCDGKVVKYTRQYCQEFMNDIPNEEEKAMKKVMRKTVKINLKERVHTKFKKLLKKVLVKALQYTEE